MSGSAVRGIVALAEDGDLARIFRLPCLCVGPDDRSRGSAAGFTDVRVADRPDATALAELAARAP